MSEQKFGIENLCKVSKVVLTAGNITGLALADGKIDITDLGLTLQLLPSLLSLGGVDWKLIPAEVKDLSTEERAQYVEFLTKEFDIPQDKIEEIIESIFKALNRCATIILNTKDEVIGVIADVKAIIAAIKA